MQENEFEARIRKEMETLQIVPAEAVWKNVAASIEKEKRKRRFLVILFFFTLLTALGGWYFYNSNHTLPALATQENTSSTGISSNKKDRDFPTKVIKAGSGVTRLSHSSTIKQSTIKQPTIQQSINSSFNKQAAKIIKQAEVKNGNNQLQGDKNTLAKIKLKPANETVGVYKEPEPKQTIAAGSQNKGKESLKSDDQRLTATSNSPKNMPSNLADSIKETPDSLTAEAKKDTANAYVSKAKPVQKTKTAFIKKWNLGFSVFTGISNNLSRFALFSSGVTYDYANAAQSSVSTGTVNSSLSKLTYKSNFSYSLGIYLQKQVSKTIGFSAGINYHFVSASSLVGSRSSSAARTIYDTSLGNRITVNESYVNGQSVSYRNKYHLFELPLNVLIRLNKNQNRPALLTAGLAPAYLMGSNALYAGAYQNGYYTNNDQFNKWLLTAQAGFQFTVKNAKRYNVSIGPEIQYGVNNMAKSATGTKQHLFSAGLQANINLK